MFASTLGAGEQGQHCHQQGTLLYRKNIRINPQMVFGRDCTLCGVEEDTCPTHHGGHFIQPLPHSGAYYVQRPYLVGITVSGREIQTLISLVPPIFIERFRFFFLLFFLFYKFTILDRKFLIQKFYQLPPLNFFSPVLCLLLYKFNVINDKGLLAECVESDTTIFHGHVTYAHYFHTIYEELEVASVVVK